MIHILFQKVAYNSIAKTEFMNKLSPLPQKMELGEGSIILDGDMRITIEGNNEPLESFPKISPNFDDNLLLEPQWTLDQFSNKVREWLNLRLEEINSDFHFSENQFHVKNKEWMIESDKQRLPIPLDGQYQGYYLRIYPQGIEIIAWHMHGAYYGIVTLTQLIYFEKKAQVLAAAVPIVTIWDWPQYQVRGLVDDISRGQRPTLDNFKFFIRFLSRNKQNVFILYIEDIFYFKSFPRIGEGRGRLTPDDIKELQSYAKEWFVNILPGVEMLGHMDNILLDPEYMQYAEFPGAQCFDISNPKTKDFVRQLLADIVPVFEGPMFASDL